jgi:SAM-dependent methyltransferase
VKGNPNWIKKRLEREAQETQPVITATKLNLGCGPKKLEGYCNIDRIDCADVVLDLEDATLPFLDNSISEIVADQLMEHIHNFIPLMNECHRVLTDMGKLKISVPHVPFLEAFADPTHCRYFCDNSFSYFHEADYNWFGVGKTYGIKPFRHLSITKNQWCLSVTLTK